MQMCALPDRQCNFQVFRRLVVLPRIKKGVVAGTFVQNNIGVPASPRLVANGSKPIVELAHYIFKLTDRD